MNVANLTATPGREQALRVFDHYLAVTFDLLSLERGLCQPSLAPPEAAFAGQEAFAHQRHQPTGHLVFHEVVGVRGAEHIRCAQG